MRLRIVALAAVLGAAGAWLVWNAGRGDVPDRTSAETRAAAEAAGTRVAAATGSADRAGRAVGTTADPEGADTAPGADPSAQTDAGRAEAPVRTPSKPTAVPPRVSSVPDAGGRPPSDADDSSLRRRLEQGDAADADAEDPAAADRDATDRDLAERGDALGLLPPEQLEQWIDREVRRSGTDRDTARQTVLSDLALARYLAQKKAGADAPPQVLQPLIDQAMGLVPTLSADARARIAAEALAAL